MNLTELVELCRDAGLGNFGRQNTRTELYAALEDEVLPEECPLEDKRALMEAHIRRNFRRLRTQLPCPKGRCVSHGCPDIIVQQCWQGMKDDML